MSPEINLSETNLFQILAWRASSLGTRLARISRYVISRFIEADVRNPLRKVLRLETLWNGENTGRFLAVPPARKESEPPRVSAPEMYRDT